MKLENCNDNSSSTLFENSDSQGAESESQQSADGQQTEYDVQLPNSSSNNNSSTVTLVSFDGMQGVPTRTTSTLTPTTLRNIEQTFIELTNEQESAVPCQAGFMPPAFQGPIIYDQDHSLDSGSSLSNSSWHTTPPPQSAADEVYTTKSTKSGAGTKRRNMGGRRPNKPSNLTPEEEEKRKVRRERNKLAAARCRRRREDHTNELLDETDGLEKKKKSLQDEIQQLQQEKEDLEFLLDSHRAHCRQKGRQSPLDIKPQISNVLMTQKIKSEPIDSYDGPPSPKRIMLSDALVTPTSACAGDLNATQAISNIKKPNRPSSLNVPMTMTPFQALSNNLNKNEFAGIPITTPSGGMFNFDSLMDGGTGLTPVLNAPLLPCSTQTRPLELTTPTSEPSKLVSL